LNRLLNKFINLPPHWYLVVGLFLALLGTVYGLTTVPPAEVVSGESAVIRTPQFNWVEDKPGRIHYRFEGGM
jgi:hypothetical protein